MILVKGGVTHSFAIGVVKSLQLDDIRMTNDAHDLELTVLEIVSSGRAAIF